MSKLTMWAGLLAAVSVGWCATATGMEAPVLQAGVPIRCGGSGLRVQYAATPEVIDWNNDGKKDLLVGEFYGQINLLVNEGSDAGPVFASTEILQADGSPIVTSYG